MKKGEKIMAHDEAVERLILHARLEEGSFLDMLRPYGGLKQEVLDDVMDALRALVPVLAEEQLPRDLVSALWAISCLGRSWALAADGMLRRNQLINEVDQATLMQFLEQFDYAVMTLLDGGDVDEAFAGARPAMQ